MSGIAGIICFDGAPLDAALVIRMTDAMHHRGPDGIHHWVNGPVALGQCMLRTTPESLEEKQPLANQDASLVLVMDGRVDNWEELRRELLGRGAVPRDRSDAELVLRAYEVWGRECMSHIDGDFSLVIWDSRRHVAFCARDRMGNKPFNYCWSGNVLAFASELRALFVLPWVKQELNEGMLAEHLSMEYVSQSETLWTDVRRLVKAHWMEIGRSAIQYAEYWQPDLQKPLLYRRDHEYVDHYREVFFDSVRRVCRSHKKLAIEVSGGLDSSAIFAVAQDLRRRQKLIAPDLAGYSLKFDDDSDANELEYSRAAGVHLGIPVQEIAPSMKPLSWYRDWARDYREFPWYPNGVMAAGINEAARAQGCRAMLNGDGGDECLTGTRDYYIEELESVRWRTLIRCFNTDSRHAGVLRALGWLCRSIARGVLPAGAAPALRNALEGLREFRSGRDDRSSWLTPRFADMVAQRKREFTLARKGVRFGRGGQGRQYAMLFTPYNVLARESEDRIAASLGIEMRQPFWSTAMVQFALSVPERLRLQGGTNKALHRRAMTGLLPQMVLERTTKADFMVVFRRYVDEIADALSMHALQCGCEWVARDQLHEKLAQWGNPSFEGDPEWRLWTLFGCIALLPAETGIANRIEPA